MNNFFKPRIFISSLLKDKLGIRDQIKDTLCKIGAEVLLYEKNLTPSTSKRVYRRDVKEADFVIFILDEKEGTKTNTGKTGVEEEFLIASEYNINCHIYIKRQTTEGQSENELLKHFKEKGYSYYYYKNDKDLLKRIELSVFTIARDVSLYQAHLNDLNHKEKEVFDNDYHRAIGYLSINEAMVKANKEYALDYIESDIVSAFLRDAVDSIIMNNFVFNDTKIYDLFYKAFLIIEEYDAKHAHDYTYRGTRFDCFCPVYKIATVNLCSSNIYEEVDKQWYVAKLKEYFTIIDEIKEYVMKRKLLFDINFYE